MEVDGITVAKATQIENGLITTGTVNAAGYLVLTTKGGVNINAGLVKEPAFLSWPIGSIFMNIQPVDPATLLGGGTWVRWAKGRFPISLDENDTDFDGAEETGGEKFHKLTPGEMPSHVHAGDAHDHSIDHGHTASSGPSNYQFGNYPPVRNVVGSGTNLEAVSGISTRIDHTHPITVNNFYGRSGGAGNVGNTGPAGGDGYHNNMPPFVAVYMWKRTA